MPHILVCDNLAEEGLDILREAGEVVVRTGLSEAELVALAPGFEAIIVRSATQLTAPVIEAASNCRVIARAGVGVDNIDVPAATRRGILVVNSPAGNILAAAEHAVALMLAAARCLPQANAALKAGVWDRKSCVGHQIQDKTLGLVGLGNVGMEVARRARGLGMTVLAYDPYVTEERAATVGVRLTDLPALLGESDFVSLHAVASAETEHLIGAAQLAQMKPGATLINTARGSLVDEAALVAALQTGQLSAAALDVFAEEPTANQELVSLPNVIATPHVGAMTVEAQVNVALDAARQVAEVLTGHPPRWPVNAPPLPPEALAVVAPFLPLATTLGQLARALSQGPLRRVEVRTSADLAPEHLGYLTAAALAELLSGLTDDNVNAINASLLARERHVEVAQTKLEDDRGYTDVLELRLEAGRRTVVAGALLDRGRPRIIALDDYDLDLPPEEIALLIWRKAPSRPGFIGRVGTILGEADVNVSAIQVSHEAPDEVGLMALTVQSAVPEAALAQITELDGVVQTRTIVFTAL
jgi:D-3-phosphoglycerate dehydrogenase / 2-oxoglutarate reductase